MTRGLSRRRFVTYSGGAAAAIAIEGNPIGRVAAETVVPRAATLVRTVRVVRAADQLDVVLEVYDADIRGNEIVPRNTKAYVRMVFGSQHVAERHFGPTSNISTAAVPHMAAGPSVVVVPIRAKGDFTLAALVALAGRVGVTGQTRAGAPPLNVTALEVPASLVLSPATGTRLQARSTPRTINGVTETWIARFARPVATDPVVLRAIENRASSDLVARLPTAPQRSAIVTNSTSIAPMTATRLWLSSDGAFVDVRGDWPSAALTRYRHRTTSGRDLSVEVAESGYLLPFGHRASIVSVATREITTDSGGGQVFAVRQRRYLELLDETVRERASTAPDGGRGTPFRTVRASTNETDPIDAARISDGGGAIPGASDIRLASNGSDVMVDYVCTDRDGNTVTLSWPATFISAAEAFKTSGNSPIARLRAYMNAGARQARRSADLGGQLVGFADPSVPGIGMTSRATYAFEMEWLASDATKDDLEGARSPNVFPSLKSAWIVDSSVAALLGEAPVPFEVELHPRWLAHGINPAANKNFDLSYLKLKEPAVSKIGGDTPARGVVAVELTAEVLNQTAGAGLDMPMPTAPWNPASALGDNATLIGNITLEDVLQVVDFATAVPGIDIPGVDVTVDENTITTTFSYSPAMRSNSTIGFVADADTTCRVTLTGIVSIDGSTEPEFITEVSVEDFTLSFPTSTPVVDVHFAEVSATMTTSSGLDIDTDVSGVTLYGDMAFVSDLFAGVGLSGPRVAVTQDQIDFGIGINIPDVNLGVAKVENIGIDFALVIPLQDGYGQLSIDVGTRADPLTLAVMSFGGTFYVGIDVRFGGSGTPPNTIRIGLSIFWEILDIDVIIAQITVTLRVAADWILQGDDVVFTGTISIEGYIGLCGFVEVSLIAALSLTYRSVEENLVIKGTISWSVDTPLGGPDGKFVIGQTTIDMSNGAGRGGFGRALPEGPGGNASFGDIHTEATWADYCDAFA